MKLRYILGAVLSVLLFAACSDESNNVGPLSAIQLDQTYVTISENGGSASVTIKAAGDWKFDDIFTVTVKNSDGTSTKTIEPLPDWLTASQVSGTAGETVVTLTAAATSGGREAELHIVTGGNTQILMVRQGSMEATMATCAEVIAAPDGKTFRVKGTCTQIANTTYGNWYLTDATGQVYIYGTLDANGGTKNFTSLGIEVGDVITVEGPKTTYGTTVELVDVTVIKIEKSLIKIVSDEVTLPQEGGDIDVKVAFKGTGAYVNIPDDVQSWITYKNTKFVAGVKTMFEANPADTAIVTLNIAANAGATRTGAISISSSNAKSTSSVSYTIKQEGMANPPTGSGTAADPFNVTKALQYTKALGSSVESTEDVYVKGKISSIKYTYSAKYGTATYNISADGEENDVFTVYGSYYFDNKKWEEGQPQIEVGDEVIVCGKVIYYKGETPEFSNTKSWLVSLNGKTSATGDAPKGTVNNPFTVAETIAKCQEIGSTSDGEIYFAKGKISSIKEVSTQYGNATFNISDDGTENNVVTVFRSYDLGNVKFTAEDAIKVGDEVIITGKLVNYKGETPEFSGNVYIYSLNGKTE